VNVIHIIEEGFIEVDAAGNFEVWIDDDSGARNNGLCVGLAETREEALNQAIQDLEDMIDKLRAMKAHP
jgi:hypothetical protein